MENKTTTELLDILYKIEKKSDDKDFDWDKYSEAVVELKKRPPFNNLFGIKEDQNDFSFEERLDKLEEDIKLLKRHKHDQFNGDVLVRV